MNNEEIQVSIVCNTYNHERYIAQTLDSFLSQKVNFPIEILIHDDASTDNTPQIIKQYYNSHKEIIKPLFQKINQNSKYSITVKFQFPRIKGKYIALCEGDDYWTDSTKLQLQYDFMEKFQQCSLICHNAIKIREDGTYLGKYSSTNSPFKMLLSTKDVISNLNLFPTASMFFRKCFVDNNISFLQNNIFYDYVLKILLSTEGEVCLLPDYMSAYRVNAKGSWTSSVRNDNRKYLEHLNKSVTVLENINKYKEFKYNDDINNEILKRRLLYYLISHDFEKIAEEPLKTIYSKLPLKTKIKYFAKYHYQTII